MQQINLLKNGKLNMKILSMKKVALGLLLAGYAASSAYAADNQAVTSNTIVGNAPVIYSKNDVEGRFTVHITSDSEGNTFLTEGSSPEVGNYIHIYYRLSDTDGDTDSDNSVLGTLKVFMKKVGADGWKTVTFPEGDLKAKYEGEDGHISFKITSDMAGAEKIGFQLQEITTYGAPRENRWLTVANIWNTGTPTNPPGTITKLPDDDSQIGSTLGSDDDGPGGQGGEDPKSLPSGPIINEGLMKLGIFKYNATGAIDYAVNLADPAGLPAGDPAATPKYGDKLAAVLWMKNDSSNTSSSPHFDSGDVDLSNSYKFIWYVSGSYLGDRAKETETTATEDSTKLAGELADPNGKGHGTFELGPNNSAYSSLNGGAGYKAGIQGFQLNVTATKK